MERDYAPYGTKSGMRILAVLGCLLGAALLVLGLVMLSGGRHGGVTIAVIGGCILAAMLAMIPLAKIRGKM